MGLRRGRGRTQASIATVALAVLLALLCGAALARPVGPDAAPTGTAETTKAPAITKQPANQTVEDGQSATFTSTASGTPTPTVQWEVSTNGGATWSAIEGATATKLTIASAHVSENGNQYRAHFTNVAGEATSKAATLTVRLAPSVIQQPTSTTVEEGQNATFEASAGGSPTPTVQWQTSANEGASWSNVSGATSNQLTIAGAKTSLSGHLYRAVFKNSVGSATSEAATLTVRKAPAITQQPASATVEEGQSATFEANASGFPAPTVQWERSNDGGASWSPIEGATSTQLTIASALHSEDGSEFRAIFSNAAGVATSEAATLTVHDPPVVTEEPSSATVQAGEAASFYASASGFPTPAEQWEVSTDSGKTWSAIPEATSDTLTISEAQLSENGRQFRARFTNSSGSVTSDVAILTVATARYSAVAWGQNLYRQLGSGSFNAYSSVPVAVRNLQFVTAVAAGGRHSLALLADGTVMAWGANSYGQLGDGTSTLRETPVPVPGLSGVKAIAAGASHSLALLTNGTVMAWGNDESGQLGNGSMSEAVETPVPVKGLSGVKAIAAGASHSLALLTNGTVMAWGENESGQLGNGGTKSSSVPVAVKALSGVSAISAGTDFSLALLTNGTVEAWGSDQYGQLANSSAVEGSNVPVVANGLSEVSAIAAGAEHGLALLSNGTVKAWGEDNAGELGNGTIKTREETPVAVSGLSAVSSISAGGRDSAAVLGSGSLMTWGVDEYGTLGNGTTGSPSAVPVLVSGVRKVASVSAGGSHMLAYGEPIPTVTSVSPKLGPASGGNQVTITGTDLSDATSVHFGSAEATNLLVESSSSVTVTAPPGTGTVDVTVTTPAGTSPLGAVDRYTYQLAPSVTKLSPKSAPVAGGTSVLITGTEFTGASAVSFGALPALKFTVNSPTSITAIAPAQSAGIVDVHVTNSTGTSATSSKDHFKYTPTIEAVSPNAGPTTGGTSVTVTGTGFAPGATIFKFGKAKATAVACPSSTSCTMRSPAHEAGTVDVTATVAKAVSPVNPPPDQFSYS
jgi:alpha-tubulin suppressor-like RCC1 family protein